MPGAVYFLPLIAQEVAVFGERINLFKLFNFEIRIGLSWVVLTIPVAPVDKLKI